MSARLRVGLFSQFKSEAWMLLLAGDAEAMNLLVDVFDRLAGGERALQLESLRWVECIQGLTVLLQAVPRSGGLRFAQVDQPSRTLVWALSAEDWQDVAERTRSLAEHGAGHQYLNHHLGTADDVCAMASIGEYNEGWWRHAAESPDQ